VSWVLAMNETLVEVVLKGNGLDRFGSCALVTGFFVLILGVSRNWLTIRPSKTVAMLGAISYPIYLLHQRIAIEMGWSTDNPALLLAALLWLVTLSYVVHRWGERPLQRWMKAALDRGSRAERPAVGDSVERGRAGTAL
jgi:peptidoglycan/LPS O-acetylase OafA/YrhL